MSKDLELRLPLMKDFFFFWGGGGGGEQEKIQINKRLEGGGKGGGVHG